MRLLKERFVNEHTNSDWIKKLPYIDVAYAWGVSVKQFHHPKSSVNGFYDPMYNIIWLYNMHPRIFLHELGHLSDGRNYTLSQVGEPEIFISHDIMIQYIQDEVVAESVAIELLAERKYTHYAAGREYSEQYIKDTCELGDVSPDKIIESMSKRIKTAKENILDA